MIQTMPMKRVRVAAKGVVALLLLALPLKLMSLVISEMFLFILEAQIIPASGSSILGPYTGWMIMHYAETLK